MEKRLGRGLAALIAETENFGKSKEKVEMLKITEIAPNPFQPRKRFGEKQMEELINSIKEKGIIQPILVRPVEKGYELIAGERRLRAATELSMNEIPAIVRTDINDAASLEISIIENIQREELNPIEEAVAYQQLIEQFGYTLDNVGLMVGKDKSTISNSLRLLSLSEDIRVYIEEGKISSGHAKALLSIPGEHKRRKIAETILEKGISVRETEQLVYRVLGTIPRQKKEKNPEIAELEEQLRHKFGTKVNILQGKKRGKIEIQYFSDNDLHRLLQMLLCSDKV